MAISANTAMSDGRWRVPRRARWASLTMMFLCVGRTSLGQHKTTAPSPQGDGQTATSQPSTAPSSRPAPVEPVVDELTIESIQSRIQRVDASTDLSDANKTHVLEALRQTLAFLQAEQEWSAKAAAYEQFTREAPQRLAELKAEIARAASQPASQPADQSDEGKTLAELEQELAEADSDNAAKQLAVDRLAAEEKLRGERRRAIPELTKTINEQLEKLSDDAKAATGADEPVELTLARQDQVVARRRALDQEKRAYQLELRSYDGRTELSALRRDKAAAELAKATQLLEQRQSAVHDERLAEARKELERTSSVAESAPPAIRELAEQTERMAKERLDLAAKLEQAGREKLQLEDQRQRLKSDVAATKKQVDVAVKSPDYPIGQILRMQRARLPELLRGARQRARELETRTSEAAIQNVRLDALKTECGNLEGKLQELLAILPISINPGQRAESEARIRESLNTRRDLALKLATDSEKYSAALRETLAAANEFISQAEGFTDYIDEKALWIRSHEPIYRAKLPDASTELPRLGREVAQFFLNDFRWYPTSYILAILLFGGLAVAHGRLGEALRQAGQAVSGVYTDSFRLTAKAVGYTLLLMLLWPGLMAFVAWRVAQSDNHVWAEPLDAGLRRMAFALFSVLFFRGVCRRGGLAEKHFRWRAETVRRVRRNLLWLLPAVPLPFIIAATEAYSTVEAWRDSIGRGAFVLAMLILAIFTHRMIRPAGGMFEEYLTRNRAGWLANLRYIWYPALVLTPIVLAGMAAAGYYYSAYQLGRRLIFTVWLMAGVTVAHALVVRWLFVAQRTLAISQFRKMRAAAEQAKSSGDASGGDSVSVGDESTLDLVSIDAQTRQLVKTGVTIALIMGAWIIWIDMLPAFRFMERVTLWTHEARVVQHLAGSAQTTTTTELMPVTLANLVIALVIATATVILGKNIPGLLEISLLQRLPLEPAERYAITTVSRYLISVVGIVISFGAIGVGWNDVQWLAAAVTVGLGFGLQEIFANFVSGLIILFERPVRLGDTVTVGGVSGVISRIRIRATTIVDADRKELIIPNRELITGQVMNWTLTDSVIRVVVPVGVAYGSDTTSVRQLLLKAARGSKHVLENPKPQAIFKGFGASSLDFELRVFVHDPDDAGASRDDLNTIIEALLREAGIEIAFPQLDVHVRSIDGQPAGDDERQRDAISRAMPRSALDAGRRPEPGKKDAGLPERRG